MEVERNCVALNLHPPFTTTHHLASNPRTHTPSHHAVTATCRRLPPPTPCYRHVTTPPTPSRVELNNDASPPAVYHHRPRRYRHVTTPPTPSRKNGRVTTCRRLPPPTPCYRHVTTPPTPSRKNGRVTTCRRLPPPTPCYRHVTTPPTLSRVELNNDASPPAVYHHRPRCYRLTTPPTPSRKNDHPSAPQTSARGRRVYLIKSIVPM
jgi:hypothetical protein